MLNAFRVTQYTELLEREGWDVFLLYGHGWRKEFVRSLLDLGYAGPHAVAGMTRDGETFALYSDPWDAEAARDAAGGSCAVELTFDFEAALAGSLYAAPGRVVAVAGLELMEARFVAALTRGSGRMPVSATTAVERIRMVKTAAELDRIRRAARLADRGYARFVEVIAPGMAEFELVAEVEGFLKAEGAEDNFMLISSGGPEVRGMKPPTDRRFQIGDCVATELTPQVDGYYAQICRSLIVGEPSQAQRDAFDLFVRAQAAAEAFLAPGVDVADVARVQNDVFREAGYGEYTTAQYTRVRGHGLGLFIDEYPHILEDVHSDVEVGMVLIPHPNTYLPTTGYMVFGDALVVTEDGCARLGETEKQLFSKAV